MASSKRGDQRGRERLIPLADAIRVVDDEAALSGVWPQAKNKLFQIDGPVARLLTALFASTPDELPLNDALNAIEFFVSWYKESAHPVYDHSLFWRQYLHAQKKELDKIYDKTIELATDIRGSDALRLCWPPDRENDLRPNLEAWLAALKGLTMFVDAQRKRLVGKRGKKTPRQFVEAIIEIIEEYIGGKVERSTKRGAPANVVHEIVKIMDPAIGKGTIDEALRARLKAFGEINR